LQDAGLDVPGLFDAIARHSSRITLARQAPRRTPGLRQNAMFNGVLRLLTRSQLKG
jgi:hypothetical protein